MPGSVELAVLLAPKFSPKPSTATLPFSPASTSSGLSASSRFAPAPKVASPAAWACCWVSARPTGPASMLWLFDNPSTSTPAFFSAAAACGCAA